MHAQSFKTTFRSDVYKRDHETAHHERWAELQQLTTAERSSYFDKVAYPTNTLFSHSDSHCAMTVTFNHDIFKKVINDLLYNVDDELIHLTCASALSVFKMHEESLLEDNEEVSFVKIESVLRFKMVLGFISKGVYFQSAS